MKHLASKFLMVALLPVFFTACKKDPDFSTGTTGTKTVAVPTCRINSESSDQTRQNGSQFALAYGADGNLQTVTSTNPGSNTPITVTTISSTQVSTDLSGSTLLRYDFAGDIFNTQPANYTLIRPAQSQSDRVVYLNYVNGLISSVKAFKESDNTYLQSLYVLYDADSNATTLTFSAGTGSATQNVSWTASGFDSNPNPYDTLKGGQTLLYNWDYFSNTDILTLCQHLSRHNPGSISLTFESSTTDVTMTYQYNDSGYPTQIQESTVSNGGAAQNVVWNYTYDCK